LACLIGGRAFTRIPSLKKQIEAKDPAAPSTAMTQSAMLEFLPRDVVEILAPKVDIITETTFALILSLKQMKYNVDSKTVRLSLELHSLISDEKYDFRSFITTCSILKVLNPEI